MGHYTCVHMDFNVRADAPEDLINHLKFAFGEPQREDYWNMEDKDYVPFPTGLINEDASKGISSLPKFQQKLEYLNKYLYGNAQFVCPSHEAWRKRGWTLEVVQGFEVYHFQSFASLKYPDMEVGKIIFDMLLPYMVGIELGDIVYRECYDYNTVEEVLYYRKKDGVFDGFFKAGGYDYKDAYTGMEHRNHIDASDIDSHPMCSKEGDEPVAPAKNYYALGKKREEYGFPNYGVPSNPMDDVDDDPLIALAAARSSQAINMQTFMMTTAGRKDDSMEIALRSYSEMFRESEYFNRGGRSRSAWLGLLEHSFPELRRDPIHNTVVRLQQEGKLPRTRITAKDIIPVWKKYESK